ncbi:MAG: helix-turn-helix transcriptional regulator [Porticoccaceae bacterium]
MPTKEQRIQEVKGWLLKAGRADLVQRWEEHPEEPLTWQEFREVCAAVIMGTLEDKKAAQILLSFISEVAQETQEEAFAHGIQLTPSSSVSNAVVAVFLSRFLEKLKTLEALPKPGLEPSSSPFRQNRLAPCPATFQDTLVPVPSNPVVQFGLSAIWAGGHKWRKKNLWRLNPEANTAEARNRISSNGEILIWVDPKVEAHAAVWTMEQIEAYLEKLSDFTADVALAVLSCLAEAPKVPMLEPVIVDAEKIIQQKGIEAWGRQRDALRLSIEQEMENLQRLKFEVHKLPAPDPETGRWNPQGYSWSNDRLFDIVKVEAYQKTVFGEKESVAVKWSVRAGQWAYYFLSPQARRWVCGLAGVLLQLSHREDRRAEVLAKRIGYYVMMHKWRLAKGQPLTWSIGTLCEAICEKPKAETNPGRFRECFEKALDLLVEKGAFKEVIYPTGYWSDMDRSKGWVQRWLEYELTFVLPELSTLEKQMEERAKARAAAAKLPLPRRRGNRAQKRINLDGHEIKRARIERNLRQEELARYLGISRQYLSNIENKKALPGPELTRKIQQWLDKSGK